MRVALAGALLTLAASAPAAQAVVVPKAGGGFVGVQPRPGTAAAPSAPQPKAAAQPHKVAAQPQLVNGNGQMMLRTTVHTIFWDPAGAMSDAFKAQITRYVAGAAADSGKRSNLYSVLTQYTDAHGTPIAYDVTDGGAVTDTTAYPAVIAGSGCDDPNAGTVCLEDSQLQHEIDVVRKAQHWPADAQTSLQDFYVLITPAGVDSCDGGSPESCTFSTSNGYCAYHSAFDSGAQRVVYANVPVVPGCDSGQTPAGAPDADADGVLDSLSHEHMEAITDPNGDGWADVNGQEIADKCTNPVVSSTADVYGDPLGGATAGHTLFNEVLGGRQIYVQKEWGNAQRDCLQRMGPTPAFTPPADPATGAPTAFSGTATDPDGPVLTWTWDFGDGTATVTGQHPSHQYAAPGTYTVRLTAADASGDASATTVEHSLVVAAGPVAVFSVPARAEAGQAIAFDGSGSHSPGGAITAYAWTFGDGATATGAKPSHAYAHAGTYTVELTVTDAAGHHGIASHVLSVAGPPTAAFSAPASALTNDAVAFDASASSDPNGSIAGYAWSFGDGATGSGRTISHAFAAAGDYAVRLTVTDAAGATATTTRTVTVTAPPPPPPPNGGTSGASGQPAPPADTGGPTAAAAGGTTSPLEPASLRVGGDPLRPAVSRNRHGRYRVRTGPTLSCAGSTGSCRLTTTLYVTRRVRRHGHLVTRRVAIGHVTRTLAAGAAVANVTITLSSTGTRLLSHAPHGRLHVTLVVTGAAERVTRTGTLRRPRTHRA